FAEAKTELARKIKNGDIKPEILIGCVAVNGAKTIESILRGRSLSGELDESLKRKDHPYFCHWRDFQDWAKAQGLVASFQSRHDGGGRDSWHALVVQPL